MRNRLATVLSCATNARRAATTEVGYLIFRAPRSASKLSPRAVAANSPGARASSLALSLIPAPRYARGRVPLAEMTHCARPRPTGRARAVRPSPRSRRAARPQTFCCRRVNVFIADHSVRHQAIGGSQDHDIGPLGSRPGSAMLRLGR
jgi:hypothetical protein